MYSPIFLLEQEAVGYPHPHLCGHVDRVLFLKDPSEYVLGVVVVSLGTVLGGADGGGRKKSINKAESTETLLFFSLRLYPPVHWDLPDQIYGFVGLDCSGIGDDFLVRFTDKLL